MGKRGSVGDEKEELKGEGRVTVVERRAEEDDES
jgi:hypothetical protein